MFAKSERVNEQPIFINIKIQINLLSALKVASRCKEF